MDKTRKSLIFKELTRRVGKMEPWATVGLNPHAVATTRKEEVERSEGKWNLGIRKPWPLDFLSMTLNQCFTTPVCCELQGTF